LKQNLSTFFSSAAIFTLAMLDVAALHHVDHPPSRNKAPKATMAGSQ
jgi:hypothetical protein